LIEADHSDGRADNAVSHRAATSKLKLDIDNARAHEVLHPERTRASQASRLILRRRFSSVIRTD
jgi:hypothetical protein